MHVHLSYRNALNVVAYHADMYAGCDNLRAAAAHNSAYFLAMQGKLELTDMEVACVYLSRHQKQYYDVQDVVINPDTKPLHLPDDNDLYGIVSGFRYFVRKCFSRMRKLLRNPLRHLS